MSDVRRVYVEKKPAYAVAAKDLTDNIRGYLGIKGVSSARVLIRYDIENISDKTYDEARITIFSEPPVDILYEEELPVDEGDRVFSVEALPGQFDQRADSAEQCVKLLNENEDPVIRCATTYVIKGECTDEEFESIKSLCINPVDSRENNDPKPETLVMSFEDPADVMIFDGFTAMSEAALKDLYDSLGLAMTFNDFKFIQDHFAGEEKRDPSMTEIRVLDTYWSDHCRHTTFQTELKNIEFEDGDYTAPMKAAFEMYQGHRQEIYAGRKDKFICLMDIALMAMKKIKADGKLADQEETDEINACSIIVPVEIDGKEEEWLVNFKNETHNHPTEIEPFGGAATCLGGAIRDPLSGRTYVYQAMRVTGAADPTLPRSQTLAGKLPQRKIVTDAAHGYSSYGNQIGLATGLVNEIYHPDYVAKRMEIGAVMAAAPRRNVIRETSDPGDIIILLGGRTGRDGCGGATGSSKAHNTESIDTCGAEVQKGNAPTERKLQRLFRREEASRLIKKCNDFGAGGVSVAIGELAAGLDIDLDKVPKKYAGLDGTELAISESQERMAVVISPENVDEFIKYADEENLESTCVAVVTEDPRLVMHWRGKTIVDISRAFLDTNGAHQETDVIVTSPSKADSPFAGTSCQTGSSISTGSCTGSGAGKDASACAGKVKGDNDSDCIKDKWLETLSDLNVCSQRGLVEMFDASIGAGSVYMPYGGKYQLTPVQTMVAKLPVLKGKTDTVTMMSYGFDPYLSNWSPFHGAAYAVVDSIAKIVAAGGDYKKIRFSFQEYFRRMTEDPKTWGEPMRALLGAYTAQIGFGLPSIGGKDSMSGSFNDIHVPDTLVSFAIDVAKHQDIITPELKSDGSKLVRFDAPRDAYDMPDYPQICRLYDDIHEMIQAGTIVSAYTLGFGGIAAAVSKMAFGNKLGVKIEDSISAEDIFKGAQYGSMIAEVPAEKLADITTKYTIIGEVTDDQTFTYKGASVDIDEAIAAWAKPLEKVFPTTSNVPEAQVPAPVYKGGNIVVCKHKVAKPKVFIPVFPGTNCEYDSAKAFEKAGAEVETLIFRNLEGNAIRESVDAFAAAIDKAQILMFPGGFSAGDEPDGSGKFIATAFRNEKIKEAVNRLLGERDGLVLGICNGFQALVKLGLLPYGEIVPQQADSPTLTTNNIGRHISRVAYTKVVSNKSPWMTLAKPGEVYSIPLSHGEGRFVASDEWLKKLFENNCVATQYVDLAGNPTMDEFYNPNASYAAIEGITSMDGRILGKMGHSERIGEAVAKNIYGNQNQLIFESGVEYFK